MPVCITRYESQIQRSELIPQKLQKSQPRIQLSTEASQYPLPPPEYVGPSTLRPLKVLWPSKLQGTRGSGNETGKWGYFFISSFWILIAPIHKCTWWFGLFFNISSWYLFLLCLNNFYFWWDSRVYLALLSAVNWGKTEIKQGRNVESIAVAEAVEGCCILACSSWFAQPVCL